MAAPEAQRTSTDRIAYEAPDVVERLDVELLASTAPSIPI